MALIEHGQDATIFKELKGDSLGSLKWGIVAIFIGVGVMSGHFLEASMDDVAYPAMIFILGVLDLFCITS